MKTVHHETAGGVVSNAGGLVLVIERDVERDGETVHEVRLPKGHIDPGESAEQAALREVHEESGYGDADIVADLGSAQSTFDHGGRHHVRNERYFLMRLRSEKRDAPQPTHAEEALFEPVWREAEDAEQRMTYPSERVFITRARVLLGEIDG